MSSVQRDHKAWVIAAGCGLILLLGGILCAALIGWRQVPGLAGEWLGLVVGLFSTPFLLESGALVAGATLVIAWNSWRRHCEGEEWVDLGASHPAAGGMLQGAIASEEQALATADGEAAPPGHPQAQADVSSAPRGKTHAAAADHTQQDCTHEHT